MPPKTYLLADALRDVEAYILTLDQSSTACECCNVVKYNNFEDYRAAQELSGAASRIRKHLEAARRKLHDAR